MTTDPSNTPTEATATVTAVQTPQRAPKFQALSTYYLEHLDRELRREVYNQVLTAVNKGSLPGIVHRGNVITLDMSSSRLVGANAEKSAKLEDILLKNLPDLQARLDALSEAVVLGHVINSAGKGVTVSELIALGDDLDFDKMVATAQKKRRSNTRQSSKKRTEPSR